jgi:hypothetical protein
MATFAHCSGLTNLYWYGSSAPSVETQAFLECAHNGKLHITLSYALSQDISEGQTVSNWAELDSYGWTYTIDNI